MPQGMYYVLYDLLSQHIYGVDAVLTGDQTLTLTIMSTIGALFVVCFPFYVVWRAVRLFL